MNSIEKVFDQLPIEAHRSVASHFSNAFTASSVCRLLYDSTEVPKEDLKTIGETLESYATTGEPRDVDLIGIRSPGISVNDAEDPARLCADEFPIQYVPSLSKFTDDDLCHWLAGLLLLGRLSADCDDVFPTASLILWVAAISDRLTGQPFVDLLWSLASAFSAIDCGAEF
ncbi:MAG: hypothetical protein AAF958_15795 [Planctomycetota bacterium]